MTTTHEIGVVSVAIGRKVTRAFRGRCSCGWQGEEHLIKMGEVGAFEAMEAAERDAATHKGEN